MDFTTTTHQRDLLHILHTHREISITFNSSLTNETTLSTHHLQLHSTQYTTNHSHSIHITYTHYTTTPNTISNISTQILLKLNGKNQWQNHTLSHNSQIASYPITNHITFFILHTITTTILHNTSILIPPSLKQSPSYTTTHSTHPQHTHFNHLSHYHYHHSTTILPFSLSNYTYFFTPPYTLFSIYSSFIHSYYLPLINYPFHHSHTNTHTILHTTSLHSLITTNTPFYSIYHYPIYYTHPLYNHHSLHHTSFKHTPFSSTTPLSHSHHHHTTKHTLFFPFTFYNNTHNHSTTHSDHIHNHSTLLSIQHHQSQIHRLDVKKIPNSTLPNQHSSHSLLFSPSTLILSYTTLTPINHISIPLNQFIHTRLFHKQRSTHSASSYHQHPFYTLFIQSSRWRPLLTPTHPIYFILSNTKHTYSLPFHLFHQMNTHIHF